jgi:hypothetical protein
MKMRGKHMTVTVHIYPNECLFLEIPDETKDLLADEHPQLSHEEFRTLVDELAEKFMELVGPDFQPLSDYAVSREGIYEDHP